MLARSHRDLDICEPCIGGRSQSEGTGGMRHAGGGDACMQGTANDNAQLRRCAFCGHGPMELECGRMLPVGGDGWVHVNCAVWSSEVFEKEEGVLHSVASAVHRAHKTLCAGCGLPGASIGCNAKRCPNQYHFTCARAAGVCYTRDAASSTYCPLHTRYT